MARLDRVPRTVRVGHSSHILEVIVDEFYEQAGSLFVEAYDAFYSSAAPQLRDIVDFYERLARKLGGPALEVACGTGRITLPLAQGGLNIAGVDSSEAMLAIARHKLTALPAAVQERTTLLKQDMSAHGAPINGSKHPGLLESFAGSRVAR